MTVIERLASEVTAKFFLYSNNKRRKAYIEK